MTDDISVFTPEPRLVTVAGRTISVLPLKVGKLAAFTRALAPVGHSIMAGDLSTPFIHGFEHLRTGIAIGAGVEEAWLDDLDPDEFLALGLAVVEVNASYFRQRLAPAIAAAAQSMTKSRPATPPAGQASSPA